MPDITLRPSRLDDSYHAFKGGSCIASGDYKAVLGDARLAQGPGEKIVRGGSIEMRHPPTPAATKKAHAAAVKPLPPKSLPPKKAPPKAKKKKKKAASASPRLGTFGDSER